ncbi:MAG: cbb3-type cytochrome c oxidase subunit I [Brumimicrobium sp.]
MITLSLEEKKQQKKLMNVWGITFLIAFPLLITLGLLMRMRQGEMTTTIPNDFYMYMTLHGLGMISVLFSIAFAGLWYLISTRFVKLSSKLGFFLWALIALALLGLAAGTLIGKFGPGWYMLYPLPFINTFWSSWATTLSTLSIVVAGVAWLIGILHILYSMAKHYGGFKNLLGWQYLKSDNPEHKISPIIMIATIALIPGVFAVIFGAIFLIIMLMQVLEPSLAFDALMMKNLVMYFGHAIANITMYCAVGWVYHLLPEFTGRKIKMNKVLVYSWNATLFFIIFAFFHHLYMDFVQPLPFQIIGQIMSYASPIPATAITMFTVISQLYKSNVNWGVVPLMFLIGMAGWAIGGFAAVVDSTIAFNTILHNTLWVPAHFHTYMLMGVIPFILGFLFYITSNEKNINGSGLAKFGFWIFATASYGFLIMFYMGGLESIPRRYASYAYTQVDNVVSTGASLAVIAVYFVIFILVGLSILYISLFGRFFKVKSNQEYIREI